MNGKLFVFQTLVLHRSGWAIASSTSRSLGHGSWIEKGKHFMECRALRSTSNSPWLSWVWIQVQEWNPGFVRLAFPSEKVYSRVFIRVFAACKHCTGHGLQSVSDTGEFACSILAGVMNQVWQVWPIWLGCFKGICWLPRSVLPWLGRL